MSAKIPLQANKNHVLIKIINPPKKAIAPIFITQAITIRKQANPNNNANNKIVGVSWIGHTPVLNNGSVVTQNDSIT